ncbi:MAG: SDR family NAD(P)-dependent oxidoreductase [Geobacter sp.]|nr:SDR family NAD(P)-dependent oxidoreductase [Geobacter sp.]
MKTDDVKLTNTGNSDKLAIIGIGCLFPGADDKSSYWANIREGIDAITEIPATHWKPADYFNADPKSPDHTYGRRGGFLSPFPFNPMEYNIPPNTLEAIDTSQLLGLVAAGQALKDAGYGPESSFDKSRVSVILGVTGTLELVIPLGARLGHPVWREALKNAGVEDAVAEDVVKRIAEGYVPWQENSFPGLLGNVVAGRISKQFDLGGTNCVVDAACASSFSALHLAGMELASGKADMVVTGGVDTFNDIFMYMCFSKTPALSADGNAKPFSTDADGTTLGEGLGLVVIKRLADAERDGDKIYAVVKGIGSSSDGKGDAIYAPSADGQKRALLDAYSRAGVSPQSIGLLEAHGTGTKVGDAVEVSALREVYGEGDRPWCALGSVKSQIGHTKAAAGAAGLIKAALALHNKVIPPPIKVNSPLDEVSSGKTPFYLATEKRPWLPQGENPRRAAVSAFGFGGSNFHTVLEEYGAEKSAAEWDGNVQLLTFSGDSAASLETALAGLPVAASWTELRAFAAKARQNFDCSAPCRLALAVERDKTNLAAMVSTAATMLKSRPTGSWSTPDGACYSTGPLQQSGLLFPGQGSQYTGMLRDLACAFPQLIASLTAADSGATFSDGARLSDRIYPPIDFAADAIERQEALLRSTDVAQPAIGAVSLGAHRLLEAFGFAPAAAAGHSYGELTALCAAGAISEAELHRLSRLRGRLMAGDGGDKGGMLAVPAPMAAVEQILQEEGLDLVIANRNAPSQAVLSGRSSEIDRAATVFAARSLACKKLPVAAAFHSPLVADAAVPFLEALGDVDLLPGQIPVYANSTAAVYPADQAAARELLANQLAKPVEFVAEIEAMYAAGIRTFVEVGPGARLTALVKAILGDREHQAVALDASNGKKNGIFDLARLLAQLSVLGHQLNLDLWDEGFVPPVQTTGKKPAMIVPLCGANYVQPRTKQPPAPPRKTVSPAAGADTRASSAQSQPVAPAMATASRDVVAEALRTTRESMAILQKMQEDTAKLHRQFLEGQELAGRTFQTLLENQQRLLAGGAQLQPLPMPAQPQVHPAAAPIAAPVAAPVAKAAPAPVAQPVSQPVPAAPRSSGVDAAAALLAVVSEKTGYPVEMLDLDMGLDADLGIDSIKRVEILSAIQEKLPGAPLIGPEHMGTLQTLGQIAAFLGAGSVAAPPVAAPQAAASAGIDAAAALLAVVSEKTGYPVEMLDLDMGLDADLGIDSIKRVEILSAIQEKLPGAPLIGPEHMGTLQTLGQIAAFLGAGSAAAAPVAAPQAAASAGIDAAAALLAVVSEKTGYPVEMLDLDMGLDADLGIDSIKRVEILSAIQEKLPGAPLIGPEHMGTLQTLRQIAAFLGADATAAPAVSEPVAAAAAESAATADQPQKAVLKRSALVHTPAPDASQPLQLLDGGEIIITDDGSPLAAQLYSQLQTRGLKARLLAVDDDKGIFASATIAGLIIIAPKNGTDDSFLENAFLLLKKAAPALRQTGEQAGALFATVARLDGSFGCLEGSSLVDPLSGGLAGLTKTAAQEWSEVTCRAIDLGDFPDHEAAAKALAEELLVCGPIETGLSALGRTTLELVELPAAPTPARYPVSSSDVVVVTGGGRGVTAAAAIALPRACTPMLLLLGRSPEPKPEPAWLTGLSEEARIKRAILEHADGKLHPKEIEERYQQVVAGRELHGTLEKITAAGGKVIYRAVDIRNSAEVTALFQEVRREHGPIRGIVHGAGVLADRLITDKSREQFSAVYGTKVSGLRSLFAATAEDDLRFIALFSSTTGRFGRTGQVDYAVANEVLNKLAQFEARRRPDCRTVSINWGPWDGGMVTPALKKLFAGEGIGLIGLEEGGDFLAREIAASDAPVEITVLAETAAESAQPQQSRTKNLTEALAIALNVDDYPFLRSHVLDGKAVLPMAVIAEWLAHAALHGNPGLRFHGFNDLRICKGVVFEQEKGCNLKIMAGRAEKRGSFYLVPVELTGVNGDSRMLLHAKAEIVLASRLPEGIRSIKEIAVEPYEPHNGRIYDSERLFHGPDLHGIEEVSGCSSQGIAALVKGAPTPAAWLKQPLRSNWLTDPLALDSAFQMMILWSFERFGSGSLPCFAGRYRQFQESFPKDGVQIVIRINDVRQHGAHADMEFIDRQSGKLIARLEDYECVIDPSLGSAFQRNQLEQPAKAGRGV